MSKNTSGPHDDGGKYSVYWNKALKKYIRRKISAPTKEQIAKDPTYEPMRCNSKEFGLSSKVSGVIRNTTTKPVFKEFQDAYMSSRLTKAIRNLLQEQGGTAGHRNLQIQKHNTPLYEFSMHKEYPLRKYFRGNIHFQLSEDATTYHISTTLTKDKISYKPKDTTHAHLTVVLVAVSNYTTRSKKATYKPLCPELNGCSSVAYSHCIPLNKTPESVSFSITNPVPNKPKDVSIIAFVGLKLGKGNPEETSMSPHTKGSAMGIWDVL
ncbi:hypothetical protein SAMN05216480_109128 [Pustulibacterium marinum]|uniref:Uncharacterized protein n=1 Tax=Pustulibacterium marinum TaxID=1224947 RepID=A0A1I7HJL9_9FLAO|nr:hypothetical protein [Pustulibacterium marinum]SFU60676.1 hypothetical protein SAMN05216480_109128 [Pustulibacterium marinum]